MQQAYIKPENRATKGVFVFKTKAGVLAPAALDLLKSINCRVISTVRNRITVSSTRGNLEKVKRCWLAPAGRSELSLALHSQIDRIIIGGNV